MAINVVIAPDSFKGSLSAAQVAECIERGLCSVAPCNVTKIPMADGGEGTVEAMAYALGGEIISLDVSGPLGDNVRASYCLAGNIAVIEMAAASGITLIPRERLDPAKANTYGTGQLILDAITRGAKKIILGIGGSATNDGGSGMAAALGVRFLDKNGEEIFAAGGELEKIETIDISGIDKRISSVEFLVACDVTNTICGENGASYVFGPQKGADPQTVKMLDANLKHYSEKIRSQLGKDVLGLSGGGAAGGLGAGLYAFCNATLKSGFDIISQTVGLEESIKNADLVITGEGRTDYQTAFGKLPCGVARLARANGVPCILISGAIDGDITPLYEAGISAAFAAVTSVVSLEDAIKNASENLTRASSNAMRAVSIGIGK